MNSRRGQSQNHRKQDSVFHVIVAGRPRIVGLKDSASRRATFFGLGDAPDVFGSIVPFRRRGAGAIQNREQRTHNRS